LEPELSTYAPNSPIAPAWEIFGKETALSINWPFIQSTHKQWERPIEMSLRAAIPKDYTRLSILAAAEIHKEWKAKGLILIHPICTYSLCAPRGKQ